MKHLYVVVYTDGNYFFEFDSSLKEVKNRHFFEIVKYVKDCDTQELVYGNY